MPRLSRLFLHGLALSGCAVVASRSDGRPMVTVRNGTYTGVHSPSYGQDFFLGMPYAQV